jgi:hypothetical protein
MNRKLEQQLYNKYPKIFIEKDLPKSQTAMCWGISTGNGWYKLLDDLCGAIQSYVDHTIHYKDAIESKPIQVVATQVKEKLGTLRFYTNYYDDIVYGMIKLAEYQSSVTCDICGEPGTLGDNGGWYATRCEKHYNAKSVWNPLIQEYEYE